MRKGIMIILDGYGEGEKSKFNAVENANTPYLKYIKKWHSLLHQKSLSNFGEAVRFPVRKKTFLKL